MVCRFLQTSQRPIDGPCRVSLLQVIKNFCVLSLVLMAVSGCTTLSRTHSRISESFEHMSGEHGQVIVVEPLTGSQARVTAWELRDGWWHQTLHTMPAVVGRNGIAPAGEKREGDGRTPSGTYPLGLAFGYAPSIETKLKYRQSTDEDHWVDDSKSPQYNRWVNGTPDASSFEEMKRDDDLYEYGAVIEYNTAPIVPGNGSAIFMHVWRGPDKSTSGCVALSRDNLKDILAWLDESKHPVITLFEPLE